MKKKFFDDWHQFGGVMYRRKNGKWIRVTSGEFENERHRVYVELNRLEILDLVQKCVLGIMFLGFLLYGVYFH